VAPSLRFHRFLTSPEVIQTAFSQLIVGKERRTIFVVLSPVVQIPIALEKPFVANRHSLIISQILEAHQLRHWFPNGRRMASRRNRKSRRDDQ
jgi:hypothetical protein